MNLHAGHWVSVKDELPDDNRQVLIAIGYKVHYQEKLKYVVQIGWLHDEIDPRTQERRLTSLWETYDCDECSFDGVSFIEDVSYWCDIPPMNFE
jgi:hypothetical protein